LSLVNLTTFVNVHKQLSMQDTSSSVTVLLRVIVLLKLLLQRTALKDLTG
jgi:hypothetical protein